MPRACRLPYIPALLLLAAWPASAGAEVRRCTAADGSTIFTDKPCNALGAVERLDMPRRGGGAHAVRTQCMRSVDDLVFEMSLALDAGDANRLAGVYHWAGMSQRTAYATVERLDRIASRPLVDITPVYPEPPTPTVAAGPMPAPGAAPVSPAAEAEAAQPYAERLAGRYGPDEDAALPPAAADTSPAAPVTLEGEPPMPVPVDAAAPPPLPRPVGIKVVQTLSNGSTPSTAVFGLVRHFGCWWIRD